MPDTSTVIFLTGMAAVMVAARYLLERFGKEASSSPVDSTAAPQPQTLGRRTITDDMVTVVQTIVPQWDRESIRRDLEETRSIEETTTRLLSREPPAPAVPATAQSSAVNSTPGDPSSANLLRRYGLSGNEKLPQVGKGYQGERTAREEQLRLERQAMVIKARQRVLEMEQAKMRQ